MNLNGEDRNSQGNGPPGPDAPCPECGGLMWRMFFRHSDPKHPEVVLVAMICVGEPGDETGGCGYGETLWTNHLRLRGKDKRYGVPEYVYEPATGTQRGQVSRDSSQGEGLPKLSDLEVAEMSAVWDMSHQMREDGRLTWRN